MKIRYKSQTSRRDFVDGSFDVRTSCYPSSTIINVWKYNFEGNAFTDFKQYLDESFELCHTYQDFTMV